eukprot:c15756_g1_i1.p1 GENE.c15756_g1_i1~~c15756_g1_i1.p1  ORF type:complete len:145 (+),score=67.04 c15756_g1_i1:261-695(+)
MTTFAPVSLSSESRFVPASLSPSIYANNEQLLQPNPRQPILYSVVLQGELELLYEMRITGFGAVSCAQLITLTPEERIRANVPQTAKYFLWAETLVDMDQLHEEERERLRTIARENSDFSFLLSGGFIFLNESLDLVGVNALVA